MMKFKKLFYLVLIAGFIVSVLPSVSAVIPVPGCSETFYIYTIPTSTTSTAPGGLWGFGDNDIFIANTFVGAIAGDMATIKHWDGTSFTTQLSVARTTYNPLFLWGSDNTHVFSVGQSIGTTTAGSYFYDGSTWTLKNAQLGDSLTLQMVQGLDSTHIWAVGQAGTSAQFNMRVRFWDGTNWNKVTVNEADANIRAVFAFNDGYVAIGGASSLGYVGLYDGATWSDVSIPGGTQNIRGIFGVSHNDFWVSDVNLGFYHRVNGVWSSRYDATNAAFQLHGTSASRIFSASSTNIGQWRPDLNQWVIAAAHAGDTVNGEHFGYDRVWASSKYIYFSVKDTDGTSTYNGFERWDCYPISNAGPDQLNVETGQTIQLNGCTSSDIDSDTKVYHWTQTQGQTVVLSNANICNPTFLMPDIQVGDSNLIFNLNVNDTALNSNDTVQIGDGCLPSEQTWIDSMKGAVAPFSILIILIAILIVFYYTIKGKGGAE